MDLIGDLLGALGNAASGGLFGLVGSLIGVGAKFVQERQRQSWEMQKWAHEESLLRLETERGAQETEQELLITSEKAAADIKARSYDMGMVSGPVHTWVNDVRALFRPWLTVFLWVIVGVIMWLLIGGGLSGIIDAQDAIALIDYTVHSAVFAASAATV